jgi:hypothetical protein
MSLNNLWRREPRVTPTRCLLTTHAGVAVTRWRRPQRVRGAVNHPDVPRPVTAGRDVQTNDLNQW